MGQFPDVKWPAEFIELTRIEELLHCRICYEYIDTSVITPCSHNYCSICIRKFLLYKTQCPICFETIYEKDLHANRILDEFMESYSSLRGKLFACINGVEIKKLSENCKTDDIRNAATPIKKFNTPSRKAAAIAKTAKESSHSFVKTPKKLFHDKSSASPSRHCPKTPNSTIPTESPKIMNNNEKQLLIITNQNEPCSSSSAHNTPRMLNLSVFTPKSKDKCKDDASKKKRVPCPVCSIEISELNINRHLDDCLKRQTMSSSPPKIVKNGLEPMPKYVLNLLKDSELRKLLKKYGLSTSGIRKALEKRLQKFSVLYNAERDKLHPKSVEELVKLCEEEETTERNMTKQNSSDLMPMIDRKTDLNIIEKYHKQYLHRNKNDYQKLIESINDRERHKNKSNRSLFGLKPEDSVASTSTASQNSNLSILNESFENNETISSAGDMSQYFLHDSDSTNASYPLQHYSRDDPMKYLTLEISTDSQASPIKVEISSPAGRDTPISSIIKSELSQESRNLSNLSSSFSRDSKIDSKVPQESESSLHDFSTFSGDSKIKSEVSHESRDSSNTKISLDRVSSSPLLSRSSRNSMNSSSPKEEEDKNKDIINASNIDIFDASTEDNWSDSCSERFRENKSRKFVMKRSNINKVGGYNASSDSETDVESSFKFAGQKTKKVQKKEEKKRRKMTMMSSGIEDDNGMLGRVEESTLDSISNSNTNIEQGIIPSQSSVTENKENSQVTDDSELKNGVRRSSRKRNHVSYKVNFRGNQRGPDNGGKMRMKENINGTNIAPKGIECSENNEESDNVTSISLRKRRRL